MVSSVKPISCRFLRPSLSATNETRRAHDELRLVTLRWTGQRVRQRQGVLKREQRPHGKQWQREQARQQQAQGGQGRPTAKQGSNDANPSNQAINDRAAIVSLPM